MQYLVFKMLPEKRQDQIKGYLPFLRDAKDKVNAYDASILPGCDPNDISLTADHSKCEFKGTAADFEDMRIKWIQDCQAANKGFWNNKTKVLQQCEAKFNSVAGDLQMQQYAANQDALDKQMGMFDTITNPMLIVALFLVIIIFVYIYNK